MINYLLKEVFNHSLTEILGGVELHVAVDAKVVEDCLPLAVGGVEAVKVKDHSLQF